MLVVWPIPRSDRRNRISRSLRVRREAGGSVEETRLRAMYQNNMAESNLTSSTRSSNTHG